MLVGFAKKALILFEATNQGSRIGGIFPTLTTYNFYDSNSDTASLKNDSRLYRFYVKL